MRINASYFLTNPICAVWNRNLCCLVLILTRLHRLAVSLLANSSSRNEDTLESPTFLHVISAIRHLGTFPSLRSSLLISKDFFSSFHLSWLSLINIRGRGTSFPGIAGLRDFAGRFANIYTAPFPGLSNARHPPPSRVCPRLDFNSPHSQVVNESRLMEKGCLLINTKSRARQRSATKTRPRMVRRDAPRL